LERNEHSRRIPLQPNCKGNIWWALVTLGDITLRQFASLQTWKRSGERAPHKPLLTLQALGRLQKGDERLQEFSDLEPDLKKLLIEFGPPRQSVHPEYPFWRLQRDDIWEVTCPTPLKIRKGNTDPLKSELRKVGVKGGFTDAVFDTLQKHPEIVRIVANSILEAHFPSSLHSAIAIAVGLELDTVIRNRQRDASFRYEVISAWGHRCGFCGYDVKLDNADLGLEAAHIRWVQAGGPDILENGIACCAIHHQALDRGAIGMDNDFKIVISSRLHGGSLLSDWFLRLQGRTMVLPSRKLAFPRKEYINWHRREVFRGEPRD
jgi:putative restriction endonuclease